MNNLLSLVVIYFLIFVNLFQGGQGYLFYRSFIYFEPNIKKSGFHSWPSSRAVNSNGSFFVLVEYNFLNAYRFVQTSCFFLSQLSMLYFSRSLSIVPMLLEIPSLST